MCHKSHLQTSGRCRLDKKLLTGVQPHYTQMSPKRQHKWQCRITWWQLHLLTLCHNPSSQSSHRSHNRKCKSVRCWKRWMTGSGQTLHDWLKKKDEDTVVTLLCYDLNQASLYGPCQQFPQSWPPGLKEEVGDVVQEHCMTGQSTDTNADTQNTIFAHPPSPSMICLLLPSPQQALWTRSSEGLS